MTAVVDSFRARPEHDVELQTLLGSPLSVKVCELRLEVGDEGCKVEADLELAGQVYARCVVEGQLGLDAPHGPGDEPELDRPVRIVARLRTHFANLLARQEDPMRALLEQLFAAEAGLAHGDAWRALDVTQELDVPGVSLGYRTIWALAD
jgi:hypothetical protein